MEPHSLPVKCATVTFSFKCVIQHQDLPYVGKWQAGLRLQRSLKFEGTPQYAIVFANAESTYSR